MATIAIVMSTYNGQTFLEEQIRSILEQSYSDFTLYIRDDGSSDDTLSIINKMAAADSRINVISDATAIANSNVGSDLDSNLPALFASNYYICDEVLNVTGTFCDGNPMDKVTFQNMFFEGVFPGFTLMINRCLAELAFLNDYSRDIYYHDKWVSLIALGLGGSIVYDTTPLAKYRRHSAAASSTNLGMMAKIKWRIATVLNGDFCPRTRMMLACFNQLFSDKVDASIRDFLQLFTSKNTFKKLLYPKALRRSVSGEILLRIIILLGKL